MNQQDEQFTRQSERTLVEMGALEPDIDWSATTTCASPEAIEAAKKCTIKDVLEAVKKIEEIKEKNTHWYFDGLRVYTEPGAKMNKDEIMEALNEGRAYIVDGEYWGAKKFIVAMSREAWGDQAITYRGYKIARADHAYPGADWEYVADDYDGAEDANDHRCGFAASIAEAKAEVNELITQSIVDYIAKHGSRDPEEIAKAFALAPHEAMEIVKGMMNAGILGKSS